MYFGCETSLGIKLKVSVEALAVELGISSQPLQQCYAMYGNRVTWCWLVSLWEKCSKFKIKVCFRNIGISLPRKNNRWLIWIYLLLMEKKTQTVMVWRVRMVITIALCDSIVRNYRKTPDYLRTPHVCCRD